MEHYQFSGPVVSVSLLYRDFDPTPDSRSRVIRTHGPQGGPPPAIGVRGGVFHIGDSGDERGSRLSEITKLAMSLWVCAAE
jgi:hypothetical protein